MQYLAKLTLGYFVKYGLSKRKIRLVLGYEVENVENVVFSSIGNIVIKFMAHSAIWGHPVK